MAADRRGSRLVLALALVATAACSADTTPSADPLPPVPEATSSASPGPTDTPPSQTATDVPMPDDDGSGAATPAPSVAPTRDVTSSSSATPEAVVGVDAPAGTGVMTVQGARVPVVGDCDAWNANLQAPDARRVRLTMAAAGSVQAAQVDVEVRRRSGELRMRVDRIADQRTRRWAGPVGQVRFGAVNEAGVAELHLNATLQPADGPATMPPRMRRKKDGKIARPRQTRPPVRASDGPVRVSASITCRLTNEVVR